MNKELLDKIAMSAWLLHSHIRVTEENASRLKARWDNVKDDPSCERFHNFASVIDELYGQEYRLS